MPLVAAGGWIVTNARLAQRVLKLGSLGRRAWLRKYSTLGRCEALHSAHLKCRLQMKFKICRSRSSKALKTQLVSQLVPATPATPATMHDSWTGSHRTRSQTHDQTLPWRSRQGGVDSRRTGSNSYQQQLCRTELVSSR